MLVFHGPQRIEGKKKYSEGEEEKKMERERKRASHASTTAHLLINHNWLKRDRFKPKLEPASSDTYFVLGFFVYLCVAF